MNTKSASRERAVQLLGMKGWTKRKEGMQMLAALGERDLMIQYALVETDAQAVIDVVFDALDPVPPEVIKHSAGMQKGQYANLVMIHHVPTRNYLHAEDALADVYRGRKNKLKPEVIEAIGFSYFRKMGEEFLPGYLSRRKAVKVASTAVAAALSEETAAAAASLRRLDLPIDVQALREQILGYQEVADLSEYTQVKRFAAAEWALFDAGDNDAFEYLAEIYWTEPGPGDIATTLLKRQRYEDLHWYVRTAPTSGFRGWFCYWPLLDYLAKKGLREPSHAVTQARARGIAPPPWWSWL